MRQRLFALALTAIVTAYAGMAQAAPLDLTGFSALILNGSPSSVVESGGTVSFTENADDVALYFYNDLFNLPANAAILSFDYTFALGEFDSLDYLQFNVNGAEQKRFDVNGSGHFDIDMTQFIVGGAITEISIDWALIWGGDEFSGTTASVSNINLATSVVNGGGGTPVPEPGTLLLMGIGLAGLAGWRRKQ